MNLREGSNIEFKRQYTKDIIKTVIAFANTNGGKIYIGIEDDGRVEGVENPGTQLLMMTNAIRDTIKPDITLFTSSEIKIKEGRTIILVAVQKGTSSKIDMNFLDL